MALYLKYRPQDFNSIVGQEFIKETLKQAVAQDKTVGAYLFTGPRGTGKTSLARIFAKAINCENKKDGNPCNTCNVCKSFGENALIDIIEIDAASHTGVDNMREIIEKAQFQPTNTKYKIYIIDEVHMLSKGAFNALLKILEEPPEHVKFILATTEIHKVPDTILSRCQRYDFKNHTNSDVKERLQFIAKQENISVDDESYDYIVKSSEGGLRNAISLFEQLISDGKIEYDHIVETLGITSEEEKQNFIEKIFQKDASLLNDFESMKGSGKNLKNFFKEILQEIQNQAINKLQAGNDVSVQIEILDTLHDTLMKTKNSFDESITIKIGLLKLFGGNTGVEKPNVSEDKQELKKQETSSLIEDVQDIFAQEKVFEEKPFQDLGGRRTPEQKFNTGVLIEEVKKGGAKAALIMTLRGAEISVDGDNLLVATKTKIAYSTVSKPENKECIINACDTLKLGIVSVVVS